MLNIPLIVIIIATTINALALGFIGFIISRVVINNKEDKDKTYQLLLAALATRNASSATDAAQALAIMENTSKDLETKLEPYPEPITGLQLDDGTIAEFLNPVDDELFAYVDDKFLKRGN